jgi:hypothetical protein
MDKKNCNKFSNGRIEFELTPRSYNGRILVVFYPLS